MSNEATTFLRDTLPSLFTKGVGLIEQRANGGSENAKSLLADIKGFSGGCFVVIEGESQTYLNIANGTMKPSDALGDGLKVKLAVAVSPEGFPTLMERATEEGILEDDDAAFWAARTVSKRVDDIVAGRSTSTHITVKDVPDIGDVVARIALNQPEPPAKPQFTATLSYDDLEAVRDGDLTPQQLFMGGKLRMQGDYSLALQIMMQLATPPPPKK